MAHADSVGCRFDNIMNILGFTKNSQVVKLKELYPELEATTASVSRWRSHIINGELGPGPGMKSAKILAQHFNFSLDYLILGRGPMFLNPTVKTTAVAIESLIDKNHEPFLIDPRVLSRFISADSIAYFPSTYLSKSSQESSPEEFLLIDTSIKEILTSGTYIFSRSSTVYETVHVTVHPSGEIQVIQKNHASTLLKEGKISGIIKGLVLASL